MKNNKKHFQKLFAIISIISCLGVTQGTIDLPKTSGEQKTVISQEEKRFLILIRNALNTVGPLTPPVVQVFLTSDQQKEIMDKKISDNLASIIEENVPRYYNCKALIKTTVEIEGDNLIVQAVKSPQPFYLAKGKYDEIIITKLGPNIDEEITLNGHTMQENDQIVSGYYDTLEGLARQLPEPKFSITFGLKSPLDPHFRIGLNEVPQFLETVPILKDLSEKTDRDIYSIFYFLDLLSLNIFRYALSNETTMVSITKHDGNTYSIDWGVDRSSEYVDSSEYLEMIKFFFKKEGSHEWYNSRKSNSKPGRSKEALEDLLKDCPISEMRFDYCQLGDKVYKSKVKGPISTDLILNMLKAIAGNIQIDFTVRWYDRMLDHYNGLDLEETLAAVDR